MKKLPTHWSPTLAGELIELLGRVTDAIKREYGATPRVDALTDLLDELSSAVWHEYGDAIADQLLLPWQWHDLDGPAPPSTASDLNDDIPW